jgi:prefoldin subunit 5
MTDQQRRIEFLQNNVKSLQIMETEYTKVKQEIADLRSNHDKEILEVKTTLRKERLDLEKLYEERRITYESKIETLNKDIGVLRTDVTNHTLARDALAKEYEKKMEKVQERSRVIEGEKNQLQSEFDKLTVEAKHLKFT